MKTHNTTATTKATTKTIWGVVKRGEQRKGSCTPDGLASAGDPGRNQRGAVVRTFSTRVGSAYLRFDYLPANLGETTIRVRTIDGKGDASGKAEADLANTAADELLA